MFKKFMLKAMLGSKMKAAGASSDQIDALIETMEKNPEIMDVMKKFKKQVDEIRKHKPNISEEAASQTVMRLNQGMMRKIMGNM